MDGKCNADRCSVVGQTFDCYRSVMLFNNLFGHCKPEAGPFVFRCMKRLEDLVELGRGYPFSCVSDCNMNASRMFMYRSVGTPCLDRECPCRIHGLHRVDNNVPEQL